MKRFFRSPLMWIVFLACVGIVVMYHFGFRITYAPELETSWDAVAACASWAGVLASTIAIIVAIDIPKRIAEQQNKIALYEKRYSAYNSFAFIMSAMDQVINNNNISDKTLFLNNMVITYKSVSVIRELTANCEDTSNIYTRLIFEAGKIKDLYELKEMNEIIDFLITVDEYVSDTYKGKTVDCANLKAKYDRIKSGHLEEKLEVQLKI